MEKEKYSISLDNFQGPLDLLLHLIEKNEIDLYDIPIARITEQYLEYIYAGGIMDLETASDFLVMAATLISIKTKMLLPPDPDLIGEEEETDPREELMARLIEYKKFKEAASSLGQMAEKTGHLFYRDFDEKEIAAKMNALNPVEDIDIMNLALVFAEIMEKASGETEVMEMESEKVSITECIKKILDAAGSAETGCFFGSLFPEKFSRRYAVTMFMAVLELVRVGRVSVRQEQNFGSIYIVKNGEDENEAGQ